MNIDRLSYSSIKMYLEGCQRLLYERKVNNNVSEFNTQYFNKGKALHSALESYYNKSVKGKKFSRRNFDTICASYGIIEVEELNDNYSVFENFVKTRNYEKYEIIETELKFDIYTKNGVRLGGFMDLVYKDGEDIYIVDFKSDIVERNYDIQKMVYSVAIRYLFDAKKYNFVLDFLNSKPYLQEIDDKTLEEYENKLSIIDESVRSCEFEELEHRSGPHCASCPEEILLSCPIYKRAMEASSTAKEEVKKIDNKVLDERSDIMSSIKILNSRKDQIDQYLKQNAEKEGFNSSLNSNIKLSPNRRYTYNLKKLYKKFGNKILDIAKVSAKDIKSSLEKDELEYAEATKESKITGVKLTVSKKKNRSDKK